MSAQKTVNFDFFFKDHNKLWPPKKKKKSSHGLKHSNIGLIQPDMLESDRFPKNGKNNCTS